MNNIFDQMASEGDRQDPPFDADITKPGLTANDDSQRNLENAADVEQTSVEIKGVVQELLKHGFLEEANRRDLFRRVIVHMQAINLTLEPLDLSVRLDSHRGVAFLAVAQGYTETQSDENGWTHPLVRKQRLTLEQSLLIAILRQAFVMHEQEYGVGQAAAKIAIDELLPTFLTYVGESGSDSRDENRLLQLLDQLKAHGIVSEVDQKHEVTIRPLIAHLANPESLTALLGILKEKSQSLSSQSLSSQSLSSQSLSSQEEPE